ncbi:hypothetical protein BJY01DRAFT_251086 [Aspergillus pseudoustus]|uniref:Uncharacterized protein n=1 Tax=Aspergillus pseudoustus TaxID=1810923 RepID=A0ABR4JF03_9EURO
MEPPLHLSFAPTEITYASSISLHDTPTRKRRYHGCSTDTAPARTPDEDGIIETDYCAGGPVLVEPPCLNDRFMPTSEHKHRNLVCYESGKVTSPFCALCWREDLRGILQVHLLGRRSLYGPEGESVITLLVLMDREESDAHEAKRRKRSWTDLARLFLVFLREKKHLHGFSVGDCGYEVHVAREYSSVLSERCSLPLGCFRVGGKIYTRGQYFGYDSEEERQRCPPTVMLGVDRLAARDWREVRGTVVDILDARGLGSIAVLIRKDTYPRSSGKVARSGLGGRGSMSSHATTGNDIVLETLGGWVELKNPTTGDWVPMAVTSSRVCFPPEEVLSPADLKVLEKWKQDGVQVRDTDKSRLLAVDSPSRKDIVDGIRLLTRKINQEGTPFAFEWDGERESAQRIADWKKERQTMEEYLRGNNHIFGEDFASSWLHVAPSVEDPSKPSIRDWALVRPSSNCSMGKNNIEIAKLTGNENILPFLSISLEYRQSSICGWTK